MHPPPSGGWLRKQNRTDWLRTIFFCVPFLFLLQHSSGWVAFTNTALILSSYEQGPRTHTQYMKTKTRVTEIYWDMADKHRRVFNVNWVTLEAFYSHTYNSIKTQQYYATFQSQGSQLLHYIQYITSWTCRCIPFTQSIHQWTDIWDIQLSRSLVWTDMGKETENYAKCWEKMQLM